MMAQGMMAQNHAASLTLSGLGKRFGSQPAVADVNLAVEPGELIVLLGPSGCGKTTTLRMIAGFVPPSAGDILLDGSSILGVPAYRRDMGIVFQSYALFPHMSVARNVRFGLEMRRWPAIRADQRVAEMLRMVGLESFGERLPGKLSGGQQQRVALARALAIHPKVLLLDEPLSNLDAALRLEMAREIRILQQRGGITAIMVTHDQGEAMAMADRLVVMREGRVQQIGRQEDLYERPETSFVAGFIGRSNLVAGRVGGGAHLETEAGCRIALAGRYRELGRVCLAVRPEAVRLVPAGADGPRADGPRADGPRADGPSADGPGADARAEGTVELCTYLGAVVEHVVRLGPGLDMVARGAGLGHDAVARHAAGERVGLAWGAAEERIFDADDRRVAPLTSATRDEVSVFGGQRKGGAG